MQIRTLQEGEAFPRHLETGFEGMPVMNSYCWVAEEETRIIGIVMCAPVHGLLYIVRLRVVDGAPKSTAFILLRHAMRDAKAMGFVGYFTQVNPTTPVEQSLISICRRAGGVQPPVIQVALAGRIEDGARF